MAAVGRMASRRKGSVAGLRFGGPDGEISDAAEVLCLYFIRLPGGSVMRMTVCSCLVVIVFATSGNGSPQNAAETPKMKASAELVLVPVVVHKGSAHVGGLKKSDFTLMQDGQPQEIAVFEEVHTSPPTAPRPAEPQGFSNNRTTSETPERLTVIAIDLVNTAPLDQAYLKQELIKFLDSAKKTGEPYSLVAISSRGVTVLQNFTTDPSMVAEAARKVETVPMGRESPGKTGTWILDTTPCALSAGCGGDANAAEGMKELAQWEDLYKNAEPYEIFRDRTSRLDTLSALQQIAQYLRGFPGRKTLVWAGSGVQWAGGITRMTSGIQSKDYASFDTRYANQNIDANMHTLELLSAANVSVYPLDARHGANTSFAVFDVGRSDAPVGDRGFAAEKGRVQNEDQERITMFQQIAASTGGKPCFNRTDLANCLHEFSNDSHDYYMLGYYVNKKTKPGWHPIMVKLDQKAELRHRSGFIMESPDGEKLRLTDLQLAMISPLPYTAIAIDGRFSGMEEKGGKKVVHFELDMPPRAIGVGDGNVLNFDVVAVARGIDGKEAAKFAQRINRTLQPQRAEVIQNEGIHYTNKIELPNGVYGVWFVVRDNSSGRTGSVTTTLRIQ